MSIQRTALGMIPAVVAVVAIIAVSMTMMLQRTATASPQDQCPDLGDPGNHFAAISMKKYGGSCTVPDGGYVTLNQLYTVGFTTSVTGYCQPRLWDPNAEVCFDGSLETRNIGATALYDSHDPAYYFGVISPSNSWNIQTLDTTSTPPTGTTSSGILWGAFYEDNHVFTSVTNWNTTSCNYTPLNYVQDQPFHVNVLRCVPHWNLNSSGNIVHLAPGSEVITNAIYIPPTLVGTRIDDAIQRVISSWNTALTAMGVGQRFQRTTTLCGGPHCIKVELGTPTLPGACAETAAPNTSDGLISNASTMTILSTYNSSPNPWPDSAIDRTVAHELEHTLGMSENSCTYQDSLMGTFTACYNNFTNYTAPMLTDKAPVQRTVYGGGTQATCP